MLASELRFRGLNILTTCEPGGTPLGRRLRAALLETEETVAPLAELLLFAADRTQHVNFLVQPALAEGKIVISDRYSDATFAYQGAGRGFPVETIAQVIELATGGLKPDLTLFFDIPVTDAIARINSRNEGESPKNRMDAETADFYERVRAAYLKIAAREEERFRIIEANGPIEEIKTKVLETVTGFLSENVKE